MKFLHAVGIVLMVFAFGFVGLAAYEMHAVWDAHKRSDEILARAMTQPRTVEVEDLSSEQMRALLSVEDPAFFDHKGIDISSPGQGMTTITQALVKLLYFDRFKPGYAKIEQSLIARFVLDHRLTKEEQLSIFLNQTYFGKKYDKSIKGFGEASTAYFDKPFGDLSKDEFIGLVGMLIGPNALRPDTEPEAHQQRVVRIKRLLAGLCQPAGVLDPWFEGCATKTGA